MTASTITGIILLLALAVWAGHDIWRILERKAWLKVITTLKEETGDGDHGKMARDILDRVWWRRSLRYP